MKKVLIFGLLVSLSTAHSEKPEKRFFCDFYLLNGEHAGKKGSDYFDRLFVFQESSSEPGVFTGRFPLNNIKVFEMRRRGDFLFGFWQKSAGKRDDGTYAEVYEIYRLNIPTGDLIESYVFYAKKEGYASIFKEQHPYSPPLSEKPLEFVDKEIPEGFSRFGYDADLWRCKKLSPPFYYLRILERALYQILAV